jgi:hypothetical protein
MRIEFIIVLIIYIFVSVFLSIEGRRRNIGGLAIFFISIILTPVVGMIFLFTSPRKATGMHYVKQYRCKRCKFNFTEKHDYCPICEREGIKVELEPRWMKII